MHQDYVPVANSGFPAHSLPGPHNPPVGLPSFQLHTRPVSYEVPSVQHAQFVPQYSKPTQHFATFIQNRPETVDQQAHYEHTETSLTHSMSTEGRGEMQKIPEKEEKKREIAFDSSSPQEEAELHQSKTETATVSVTTSERVPTPVPQPMFQVLEDEQNTDEVTHSPSETTLVPSPLSSDGIQTLCNSPIHPDLSDSDEEELTANEDDQIPTKDTSCPGEYTLVCSSVERLEPEHPYDVQSSKPADQEKCLCEKLQPTREEPCSVDPVVSNSFERCDSNSIQGNQSQNHHRSIRSLIDSPVYNTSHSTVLCQLTQSSSSPAQPCIGIRRRPLTTHFRQLFKPISPGNKTQDKAT